jgi:acyl-CoA thioesterase-2
MAHVLDGLIELLSLEKIEENLFRGQSQDLGWGVVFGGQVLGQALSAAAQTVPSDRHVHSLHAYFLRPGDVTKPIVYNVDRIRDGGSFTTRRVVAIQSGEPIFNLASSFQVLEKGFEHQDPAPHAPAPDTLLTEQDHIQKVADKLPPALRQRATAERPFETRPVESPQNPFSPQPVPPDRRVWMRTVKTISDNPSLHAYLLAYASDFSFVTTSLLPHAVSWLTPGMQVASLDHVMWFHRPFRVDEWFLYDMHSPAAFGARGLVRGSIYNAQGTLVASTAQEGLIRKRSL